MLFSSSLRYRASTVQTQRLKPHGKDKSPKPAEPNPIQEFLNNPKRKIIESTLEERAEYWDNRKKSKSGDDDFKSTTEDGHPIHSPASVPTFDEYKKNNVLQDRLGRKVSSFLTRQHYDQIVKTIGAETTKQRQHLIFSGAPGTGKTMLARILGRHFRDIGILDKGHVVETTASALIGKYVGYTAHHVRDAVQEALGGVLFIDEVYHFAYNRSYGPDAVNELLAQMENHKDQFILVVAGYKDQNDFLLSTNAGLRDRFAEEFFFDNFTRDELEAILKHKLKSKSLSMTKVARGIVLDYLIRSSKEDPKHYSNARTLEVFLEKIISQHAHNLRDVLEQEELCAQSSKRTLLTLTKSAVLQAVDDSGLPEKPATRMGFQFADQQ